MTKQINHLTLSNQTLKSSISKSSNLKPTATQDTSALLDVKIITKKDPVLISALDHLLKNMKINVDNIDAIKER